MLSIENLTVHYGHALALENVNLSVPDNGLTAIIGPNGAGKTTLLRAISRLVDPTAGSIIYNAESLLKYSAHKVARMGIAHCPEGRKPFLEMTVLENLLIGAYALPKSRVQAKLAEVFRLFPILEQRKTQDAMTLSGGELQMMAIGRALMAAPSLLLIDEPSLGLAPIVVDELQKIVADIKRTGVSVLMVEGDVDLISELADLVYVFDHGVSVFSGTVAEVLNDANLSRTYLGM
jgi:branched-chain amino acid transport system ATP-binding protein